MKNQDIMYSISVEDIQQVAMEKLDRELTAKEIAKVADAMGNYLDWYNAIDLAIDDAKIEEVTATLTC